MKLWLFDIINLSGGFNRRYFDSSRGAGRLYADGKTAKEKKHADKFERKKGLCCAKCLNFVTEAKSAVEVEGKHHHIATNPAGVVYEIRLFAEATCQTIGPLTSEHSWFHGYAWQIATCIHCQEHLGWSYQRSVSPDFYGLISHRLVETKEK